MNAIEQVKSVGSQLSNVAFNWAQHEGHVLTANDCAMLDALRRKWDEAAAALSSVDAQPFQQRVQPWMMACFGAEISADRQERNHRFFEESTELVQACGMTQSEAHQLVDYVYGRPVGEKYQEAGGVMVTLAALCLAQDMDMHAAGETELARIWTKVEKIRAKQAAKPKHSPLPEHVSPLPQAAQPMMKSMDDIIQWLDSLHETTESGAVTNRKWPVAQQAIAAIRAQQDYPECSGNPADCPENEGRGCCKPNHAQPEQAARGVLIAYAISKEIENVRKVGGPAKMWLQRADFTDVALYVAPVQQAAPGVPEGY